MMLGWIVTCKTGRCGCGAPGGVCPGGGRAARCTAPRCIASLRPRSEASASRRVSPSRFAALCKVLRLCSASVALDRVRVPPHLAIPSGGRRAAGGRRRGEGEARRSRASRLRPPRRVALWHSATGSVVERSSSAPVGFEPRSDTVTYRTTPATSAASTAIARCCHFGSSRFRGCVRRSRTRPAAADGNSVRYHRDLAARQDSARSAAPAPPHVRSAAADN
ncbi:unnamed protein product, partial [Brenthis ino]